MDRMISLPSVDQVLQDEETKSLIQHYGRELVVDETRDVLQFHRNIFLNNKDHEEEIDIPGIREILVLIRKRIEEISSPSLLPVINATGVILHTNLGRAPLSRAAIEAIQEVGRGYSNLEFDIGVGKRGTRSSHVERLLIRLTGAEAAYVVNNNAAAILLILSALAKRRRVIISRTQLIEIGGGFRLPAVMLQSGARLVEVGTTNRVRLIDYEEGMEQPAAIVLWAHHSNFRITGFTEEPELVDLSAMSHRFGTIFVDDLGSGALLDTSRYGLSHEPMVQEAITASADLVCFSGDKLLGGPQAGIIVGKRELISKLKVHQLGRAVRVDKLCLAALEATLLSFIRGRAEQDIPVWRMISETKEQIEKRCYSWQAFLGRGEIIEGLSTVGGGSLPGDTLPTSVLAIIVDRPNLFTTRLRTCTPPIIARVADEQVILDPRTVLPEQEETMLHEIRKLLG